MSNTNNSLKGKINTNTIIGLGLLTAIVVVMQFISMGLRFGTFSITLTLIPIVVGSALYGWGSGAWLGFVFGVTVLLTGDANLFLAVNIPGTIITVILKGTLAGAAAGFVYKLISKKNQIAAVIVSSHLLLIQEYLYSEAMCSSLIIYLDLQRVQTYSYLFW